MKKLFYALAFLVTTLIQIYITRDLYAKLSEQAQAVETSVGVVDYVYQRSEFIESTVLRHDEEIGTLKEVCRQ